MLQKKSINIELSDYQLVVTPLSSLFVMWCCKYRKVEGHVNDALEPYRQPLGL